MSKQARWTLVATATILGLASLDTVAVNVALPSVERELHAPVSEGAWVVSAYLLGLVGLVIVAGRVSDQFGRRRTILGGTLGFTAASLLCALAPDTSVLIVARGLQGMAAAFMLAPGRAVLIDAFPRDHWGRALGIGSAVASAAVIVGPMLAGVLTDAASWRWVFLINLPLAILAIYLVATKVAESRDPTASRHLDLPGALVSTLALTSLVLALLEFGGKVGERVPPGIPLAIGVALLVVLVLIERRARSPLVELSLLRRRGYALAGLVRSTSAFTLLALLVVVLLFEQDVLGYSAFEAGASVVPLVGTAVVVGPLVGIVVDRTGVTGPLFAGLAIMLAGLGLMLGADTETEYAYLLAVLLVVGVGNQVIANASNVMAMDAAGRDKAGQASGMLSLFRRGGGLLGVVLATLVFSVVAREAIEQRVGGQPPLAAAVQGVLHDDLDHDAPGALLARAHRGTAAAVVSHASADGLSAVVLMALLLMASVSVITAVVWRR